MYPKFCFIYSLLEQHVFLLHTYVHINIDNQTRKPGRQAFIHTFDSVNHFIHIAVVSLNLHLHSYILHRGKQKFIQIFLKSPHTCSMYECTFINITTIFGLNTYSCLLLIATSYTQSSILAPLMHFPLHNCFLQ